MKECTVCGIQYKPTHGNQRVCPECKTILYRNKGRNLPSSYEAPTDVHDYESKVRRRWADRFEDNIVADGYADRQRANTLSLVPKIRVEL